MALELSKCPSCVFIVFTTALKNFQLALKTKNIACSFLCPIILCLSHSPDAADSSSFDVQLGDIILTATDGLFDNMPDYMILQELKKLKVSDPVANTGLLVEVESEICVENNLMTSLLLLRRTQTMRAFSRLRGASQSRPTFWHMTPTTCRLLHSLPVTMV